LAKENQDAIEERKEALFMKSVIARQLADLYKERQRVEQWKQYSHISEFSANAFNELDNLAVCGVA